MSFDIVNWAEVWHATWLILLGFAFGLALMIVWRRFFRTTLFLKVTSRDALERPRTFDAIYDDDEAPKLEAGEELITASVLADAIGKKR